LGWRIQYGRGQTLEALGKSDDAIGAYKEAIQIIEDTRSQISEERYRAGYIEDRYQVYVALVELLLKLGKPDDAFLYSEKLRARVYFDQLRPGASVVNDAGAQQRIRELGRQIRSIRPAIHEDHWIVDKARGRQAV